MKMYCLFQKVFVFMPCFFGEGHENTYNIIYPELIQIQLYRIRS